jgi:transposase
MRYVGIDIGSEKHFVAALDDQHQVAVKAKGFTEDDEGYAKLLELLPAASDEVLIGMEATGHYWMNLYGFLTERGFSVVVINPLRTRRFAQEDLERTKTDSIDALGIARFLAEKRPAPTRIPDDASTKLSELVKLRDRLVQDLGDRVRQLHRVVDLGFPEFTRYVKDLSSQLATAVLAKYPTSASYRRVFASKVASIRYGAKCRVGDELAKELVGAARKSVGRHHGDVYDMQVRYFVEDIDTFRERIVTLDADIDGIVSQHELAKLFVTMNGIGPSTAARIIATVGDPSETFRDAAAFASYVGAVPGLSQSGKRTSTRASLTPVGNKRLRTKLYLPTIAAVKCNPWIRQHYLRLKARGKESKVALIACLRKLLHALYSIAKNRRPFELPAGVGPA